MNDPEKKCFSVDVRRLALGIFYILLIGVVLYGRTAHVYDGFGKGAPWVIIALFAFMGIVRIAEAFIGKNILEWLGDIIRKPTGSEGAENAGDQE